MARLNVVSIARSGSQPMIYRLLIDTITSTFDGETGQWRDHLSYRRLGYQETRRELLGDTVIVHFLKQLGEPHEPTPG